MPCQRAVGALCTLNNPTVDTREFLETIYKDAQVCYVNGQLERGEEGTPHIQYYIHCTKEKSAKFYKQFANASHVELVRRDNGASSYCLKEETRLEGPFEFGLMPAQRNKKGDLARRNKEILEMGCVEAVNQGLIDVTKYKQIKQSVDVYRLDTKTSYEASDVRGVWIYGPPGVGKSHYARENYPNPFDKQQSKWFDGYTGEEYILIDDLDNDCLDHYLKRWADKYACTGETKGGTIPLLHRKLIVTSNFSIEELFKDKPATTVDAIKRRFKVVHIPQMFTFSNPLKEPVNQEEPEVPSDHPLFRFRERDQLNQGNPDEEQFIIPDDIISIE